MVATARTLVSVVNQGIALGPCCFNDVQMGGPFRAANALYRFNSAMSASTCWNCRQPAVGGLGGHPVARQP